MNHHPVPVAGGIPLTQKPRGGSVLVACMGHLVEGGLERYVENGARLLEPADIEVIALGLQDLPARISALPVECERLGYQLELFASLLERRDAWFPETVRQETAFALLYAADEMDLLPDSEPGVGYLDDVAVAEVVLSRHAEVFERHCAELGQEWSAVQPQALF